MHHDMFETDQLLVAGTKELLQAEDQECKLKTWRITSPFLVSSAVEWYKRQIWLSATVVQRLPMGLAGSYISATVAALLAKAPDHLPLLCLHLQHAV